VRILIAPYEDRLHEGWEMNVMYADGTLYFEEQISEEKIREKCVHVPLLLFRPFDLIYSVQRRHAAASSPSDVLWLLF
jgi:hypothetical protein